MQKLTNGTSVVMVEGKTVREVIDNLDKQFPGIKDRLCENDRIRPNFAVAVNSEIITVGLRKQVEPDSEVHFLPAVSGG
jgi:molybdopterin synthase sulfur carrier subunit